MKKVIIAFILGGIVFGSIGIYAASYLASDISYQPSDTSWEVDNVNDAINSLYSMKKELDNIKSLGDATAGDITTGKTAVVQGKLVTGTMTGAASFTVALSATGTGNRYSEDYDINGSATNTFTVNKKFKTVSLTGGTLYLDGVQTTYTQNQPVDISNVTTVKITVSGSNKGGLGRWWTTSNTATFNI